MSTGARHGVAPARVAALSEFSSPMAPTIFFHLKFKRKAFFYRKDPLAAKKIKRGAHPVFASLGAASSACLLFAARMRSWNLAGGTNWKRQQGGVRVCWDGALTLRLAERIVVRRRSPA